jgi:hypothetical protein
LYDLDPHLLVVCDAAVLAALLPAGLWMPIALYLTEQLPATRRQALEVSRALARADVVITANERQAVEPMLRGAGWTSRDIERQVLIGRDLKGAVRALDAYTRGPIMRTGSHDEIAAFAAAGLLVKAIRAYQLGGPGHVTRRAGAHVRRRLTSRLLR